MRDIANPCVFYTGWVISNGPPNQFASFITFFLRFFKISSCQHVNTNKTKLFSISWKCSVVKLISSGVHFGSKAQLLHFFSFPIIFSLIQERSIQILFFPFSLIEKCNVFHLFPKSCKICKLILEADFYSRPASIWINTVNENDEIALICVLCLGSSRSIFLVCQTTLRSIIILGSRKWFSNSRGPFFPRNNHISCWQAQCSDKCTLSLFEGYFSGKSFDSSQKVYVVVKL